MEKTVCELFAGVGGFRCGLNHIKNSNDTKQNEKWNTVWFSQWEPAERNTQYAHGCYVYNFGTSLDLRGNDTTNFSIEDVDKKDIPDFNLLVGGFPCQDYSVANSLSTSKGIEGKKGVLWWSIRDVLEAKQPAFVLLENVDRLLLSPAKQRGRDFSIILACFRDQGYSVEWRVINAAEYGYQQRRRRVFIFAYRNDTEYAKKFECGMFGISEDRAKQILLNEGFFAQTFPVHSEILVEDKATLPIHIGEVSSSFKFNFQNAGVMSEGYIHTIKTKPYYNGAHITLGDILEKEAVDDKYLIPDEQLYYTTPDVTHSDETEGKLPKEKRHTWQYIKGAKRILRTSSTGHEYLFSEGAIAMIDEYDKPARTMLTSEGSFNRSTHIVRDRVTGRIRLLTAEETERIQGFPTGHTKLCLSEGKVIEMPLNKRRFMMGNALVVNLIEAMEITLSSIFEHEH